MSSSSESTADQSHDQSTHRWGHCGGRTSRKANWSGVNLAAMVLGFVLFWPIGLFMLYWIISGRDALELPHLVRQLWSMVTGNCHGDRKHGARSDNVVFNEFQQTQYDRIREIKEEIKERARRFHEFRATAKRRADEEEFNRFMADSPVRVDG